MRRTTTGGLVALAVVLGTATTGGAEPTRGETKVLTCGDATLTIQTSPGGGVKTWGTNGSTYQLKSFELRIYRGDLATEPSGVEPLVEVVQSYGNRVGQGAVLACTTREHNPDHNATAFEYLTVTSKS